jgi:hypothetical protein
MIFSPLHQCSKLYAKTGESACRADLDLLDLTDVSIGRSRLQFGLESRHVCWVAFCQNLDSTIGQISNVAHDAMSLSYSDGKVTKPDTLHSTTDEEPTSHHDQPISKHKG